MKNINNNPCEGCSAEHCEHCEFKHQQRQHIDYKKYFSDKKYPELEGDRLDPICPPFDPSDDYRLGTDPADIGFMNDLNDSIGDHVGDDYWFEDYLAFPENG